MKPLVALTRSAVAGLALTIGMVVGMAAPNLVWWDTLLVALGAASVLWVQWLDEVIRGRP